MFSMELVPLKLRVPEDLHSQFVAYKPGYLPLTGFVLLLAQEGLTKFTTQNKLPACCAGAAGATTSTSEVGFSSSTSPGDRDAYSGDEQASPLEQGSLGESELIKGQPLKKGDSKEDKKDPFRFRKLDPDVIPCDLLDCQQLLPEFWSVKKGVRSESVFNRICNKLRAWTPDQRREALERAISSGWGDVFEPKPAPGQKPYRDVVTERMDRLRAMGLIGQEEE